MKKEYLQQIMIIERLYKWTLEVSRGGWHCFQNTKRITIGNTKNFALFLHEIAHAKVGCRNDKTGHDSVWGDEFSDLVNRYCLPRENLKE